MRLRERFVPLFACLALAACASFPDAFEGESWPTPRRGCVVSEHPLATAAGIELLDAGGNAVDAAVATALALAVVYPQAGNLGGGGFALWVPHDSDADARMLDFRETAPEGLRAQLFLNAEGEFVPERSVRSGLAVGVPGSPAGLLELHAELGRMPFALVARPAIRLAREGFPVDAWLARDLGRVSLRERLERSPGSKKRYYPRGDALAEGDVLVQENLARTLEALVRDGAEGFYEGEVAEALVRAVRRDGGVLDEDDLEQYEPKWRTPLRGWFRGLEVVTVPPPSSGGLILLQVLGIVDGFPLDEERERSLDPELEDDPGLSGRALHWWIEAMRRAFADRAEHMGDADFHPVPTEQLLSPSWIAQRRVSIGELATPRVDPMPVEWSGGDETTHLSVLDREGNAVSLTTTLNTTFGNGWLVEGAGFLLNNEIDDFSILAGTPNAYGLVGSEANALAPKKRPLSSMTPAILRVGGKGVQTVIGAPGGPRIITAVLQVILRTEVYGMSLEDAVSAPRLHQQWNPSYTRLEEGWATSLIGDLENRGHELELTSSSFASVQAIRVLEDGEPVGVSDPRRGGNAGLQGRGSTLPARPKED